ncbi:AAA family ATPase [Azospirillum sp. TSH64]|uniref:AAA family ATPase n=1 Tax=Azospirillum sp. TSH64 TaxID=652740 RepID=UPI000D65D639|nr:AAA family ATPase [Azospirillum sp. TSH64]
MVPANDMSSGFTAGLDEPTKVEAGAGAAVGDEMLNDPAEAAAFELLHQALEAAPGLKEMLAVDEPVAVIVEVPGSAWVAPVARIWGGLVWPNRTEDDNGDAIRRSFGWEPLETSSWVAYRRDGTQTHHTPNCGNEGVSAALGAGCSVVGFSPSPERYLPQDLIRVADAHVTLPQINAEALARSVSALTGHLPSAGLPDRLHRLITLEDLRLAWRPDRNSDVYVARLRRLLERKERVSPLALDQMHGMEEAVAWGTALARDLEDYRRGRLPWSAVDHGVLLFGPPGTGKTTFARALAGTCGVPLICGSLYQWQAAGHLGDLLKAMRATFNEARAMAPSILFIDEIDSFGVRAAFKHEYRDYSIQVVNALLEELDGVRGREGAVVVGACNTADRMDPAILRSGRLDRTIHVPRPGKEALAEILRHHLGGDLPDVDLAAAALLALGSTGADCERWVRGARRRARHGSRAMTGDDLLEEIRGTRHARSTEEAYRYAIHEAGHALVLAVERPGALVIASIRETSDSQGGVVSDGRLRGPVTRKEIAGELRMMLAGRAAEEVVFGDVSAGAGGSEDSDLARATALAVSALHAYGLDDGEDGLLWRGMPTPDALAAMLAVRPDLGKRITVILATAYAEAKDLIVRHRPGLDAVAQLLVERETVGGKEIEALVSSAQA